MKHLHFFGCSFTAGDELTDDVMFPWKHECNTKDEYYLRRNEILSDVDINSKYQLDNKALAYPAKIQQGEYQTYNYAKNGESLRTAIFRVLQLIYNTEITKDVLFLQIPPVGRELYVDDSFHVNTLGYGGDEPLRSYVFSKAISHNIMQYSLEDLMDILMLANLCKQKNIPLYLIDFHFELETRLRDVQYEQYKFIKDNLFTEINIISFAEIITSAIKENRQLLGKHYDRQSHQEMADKIISMLPEIFNLQA
jgi:hypothetical protein